MEAMGPLVHKEWLQAGNGPVFECPLCFCLLNGGRQWKQHLKGKKHDKHKQGRETKEAIYREDEISTHARLWKTTWKL